jgi:hypothetical protein
MGFWSSVGHAISSGANAVADAVETGVNAAEEAVTDVVETIGNGIEDGIDAVGDALGGVPVIGGFLEGFCDWAGSVVSGVFDLVGSIVKGVFGIIGGVVAGVIRIVGGIFSLDGDLIVKGLLDIVSGIAGAIIFIVGKAISLVQTVFLLQPPERRLTREEARMLKRVFRESVALYNVRLIEGWAGIYSTNSRPFTLGNTIYLKDHVVSQEPELLVHEVTHVWQYQNTGSRYASDAIGAQWFVDNAYSWEDEIARGNDDWVEFNKEAQAAFLENIYTDGDLLIGGVIDHGNGRFYDADGKKAVGRFDYNGTHHTDRANEGVAVVRGAAAIRLSGLFS